MKTVKLLRLLSMALAILIMLSGCSYMQFEKNIRDTISDMQPERNEFEGWEAVYYDDDISSSEGSSESSSESSLVSSSESESGNKSENIAKEEELPENVIYATYGNIAFPMKLMQIGESCKNVTNWRDYSGNVFHNGTPGVTFTLNSVEVYDNFFDSGLDTYGVSPFELSSREIDNLRANAFIVLEITAKYEVPEDARQRVMVPNEIEPFSLDAKGVLEYYKDGGRESRMEGGVPYVKYFSLRPKPDDPELDYIHECLSFMISNGEEITYKLGIIAGHEYVERKNIFIRMGWINPKVPGAMWNVYEIFPDENNKNYREKPEFRDITNVENYDAYEMHQDDWYGGINYVSETIGGTLPSFVECQYDDNGEPFFVGKQGLYLTLDKVEVYDSFEESGLSKDKLYYYVSDSTLEGEKFVVADITAEYIAPEGGPEEIKAYAHLKAIRLGRRGTTRLTDETQFPTTMWYDGEHGSKGDLTAYTIKDGEKYHYRLGIVSDPGYVNERNVFLQLCSDDYWNIENYVYKYFDLLPVE